jgi:hypothetical protein
MSSLFRSGSLGDVGMSGTFEDFTGDAVDVSDLNDVVVTMKGTDDVDNTAAMTLQYSQDGTRWAATPASSACTYGAPSASFVLTGRVKQIRALVSAMTTGSFAVRFTGRQTDQLYPRFGTLGDLTSQAAGTAVDVSELDHIIVTNTGGASSTVKIQTSYNGTDWISVKSFTSAGSYLVPLPCKLVRANCTTYSSAAYVRYGGHKAPGKQRFGTLGDFTGTTTGTAVSVSDLSTINVYASYIASGTFEAAATVLIEGSSDGTSWAIVPSGSITSDGSLTITAPYKLLRARCSSYTVGTVSVRFGGIDTNLDG